MNNVLVINSSTRGQNSYSHQLTQAILDKLKLTHSEIHINVRDLAKKPLPHLSEEHLKAFFTPPEAYTQTDRNSLVESEEAIAEIMTADTLIISTPMYNLSIPSSLKAWIDHIVRAGRTFKFSSTGPEGLVKGKKVYLAISTGSVYTDGPLKSWDFTEAYLRTILAFMGMTDVTTVRVEGVAVTAIQANALEKAIKSIP